MRGPKNITPTQNHGFTMNSEVSFDSMNLLGKSRKYLELNVRDQRTNARIRLIAKGEAKSARQLKTREMAIAEYSNATSNYKRLGLHALREERTEYREKAPKQVSSFVTLELIEILPRKMRFSLNF